ncbi:sugar nucleotide-binding protein [bacterium]
MYVIIGASGFLGAYFIKNILDRNNEQSIICTHADKPNENFDSANIDWCELYLTDFDSMDSFIEKINNVNEKINIVYLAAYHHPDKVLENKSLAWDINIVSLAYLINKIKNINTLYYTSSDVVYGQHEDSEKDYFFREDEQLSPINEYGKQKALAEQIVLSYGFNVVRYSFLIGKSLTFKKHFYDHIVDDLNENKSIEMLSDSLRSAISFEQASKVTLDLIEKFGNKQVGIVNIGTDEVLSKYDVALKISELKKMDKKNILPIKFADNNFFKEKRAQKVLLDNTKLKQLLDIHRLLLEL